MKASANWWRNKWSARSFLEIIYHKMCQDKLQCKLPLACSTPCKNLAKLQKLCWNHSWEDHSSEHGFRGHFQRLRSVLWCLTVYSARMSNPGPLSRPDPVLFPTASFLWLLALSASPYLRLFSAINSNKFINQKKFIIIIMCVREREREGPEVKNFWDS